jgi:hypothetical protein
MQNFNEITESRRYLEELGAALVILKINVV